MLATTAGRRSAPPADAWTARLAPLDRLYLDRLLLGIAPTLQTWNERVRPRMTWDVRHLVRLQTTLDRVTAGEIKRLLIEIPVRHGKTETGSVSYPVQLLDEDPSRRIILASYAQTLAELVSRKARRLAVTAGVALSEERNTAADWQTTDGGGLRAVGVGAGIAGHGADVIIVDDPFRSREDAESPLVRERVWEWFISDLLTRLEPDGAVIVTHSRWHEDDLIGRIKASDDMGHWDSLRLPAIAEEADPLGRAPGEALWPARFDAAALDEIRKRGEYAFASLYQQAPRPRNAGMFPPEKARIIPAEPAGVRWLRWWDFGGTAGAGDPTAGAKVGVHEGRVIISDVRSAQLEAAERDRMILQTATMDGRAVPQWGEQEPGSGGKAQAQAFVRLLAGWPVHTEPTRGDKATAMDPLAAQWQAGNVDLVAGPWNRSFLEQAAAAPFGRHEDAIEAASRAYNKLVATPVLRTRYFPGSTRTLR